MQTSGGYFEETAMQSAAVAQGAGTVMYASQTGGGQFTTATFQVTGTFVATVTFQGTVDGTNWVDLYTKNLATGAEATTTTGTGIFRVVCHGLWQVRANVTAWTSGSVTVLGRAAA